MLMVTLGQHKVALNSPPGALTSMVRPMGRMSIIFFFTKSADMKACEAPESNNTVAGWELTGNIRTTTSGAPSADSAAGVVLLAPVSLRLLLVPILSLLRSGPLVVVVLSFLGAGISIVPRITTVEASPRCHWCIVSLGEARGLTRLPSVLQP